MGSNFNQFVLVFKKIATLVLIFSIFAPHIVVAEDLIAEEPIIEEPSAIQSILSANPIEIIILEEGNSDFPEVSETPAIIEIEILEGEPVATSSAEVLENEPVEIYPEFPTEIAPDALIVIPTEIVTEISAEATSTEEVIVQFKSSSTDIQEFAERQDVAVTDLVSEENIAIVVSTEDVSIEETIEEILQDPTVEYAEPNFSRSFSEQGDPYMDQQWALHNTGQDVLGSTGTPDADLNAPEAWTISEGEKKHIIVAVIDTGVDYTHPDLATQMWDGSNCKNENGVLISGGCTHGYDFVDQDTDPIAIPGSVVIEGIDYSYHGTHIAGIIAAEKDNNVGVVGIAPNVQIMALRFGSDVASEIRAIDFARENGAHIINASYSGIGFSQAEYDAIQRFTNAGGIFITAAANTGTDNDLAGGTHQYPSDHNINNIISVASTNKNDELSYFSNYGNISVDVGAPGEVILSTDLEGDYRYLSGTSMATPYAVGVAGLIWGYNPDLSSDLVKDILLETGRTLPTLENKTVTGKRLDAEAALEVFDPEVLNVRFATSTAGVATINFNIRDGFDGIEASLVNFEYSNNDGATWFKPASEDNSASLGGDFQNAFITTTATSSDFNLIWNINHSDISNSANLLTSTSSIKVRFALFDGAATSSSAISNAFNVYEAPATTTPVVPDPTPVPDNGNGGGGGGGGGGNDDEDDEDDQDEDDDDSNKKGDINGDGKVDILDFNTLMIHWNKKGNDSADMNNDDIVDILDFNILMVNWKS